MSDASGSLLSSESPSNDVDDDDEAVVVVVVVVGFSFVIDTGLSCFTGDDFSIDLSKTIVSSINAIKNEFFNSTNRISLMSIRYCHQTNHHQLLL